VSVDGIICVDTEKSRTLMFCEPCTPRYEAKDSLNTERSDKSSSPSWPYADIASPSTAMDSLGSS